MSAMTPLWTKASAVSDTTVPKELVEAYFSELSEDDRQRLGSEGQSSVVKSHLELAASQPMESTHVKIETGRLHSTIHIIQPDMAHLVDTVITVAAQNDIGINQLIHPIFAVERDSDQQTVAVFPGPFHAGYNADQAAELGLESWSTVQTTAPLKPAQVEKFQTALKVALEGLRAADESASEMSAAARQAASELKVASGSKDVVEEAAELLNWMAEGNFVFLGSKNYRLDVTGEKGTSLHPIDGTGLGLLGMGPDDEPRPLSQAGRAQIAEDNPLIITKTNSRSTIYRNAYMDYIAVKTYDSNGEVDGEKRFIGLWAPPFYTSSVFNVPVARRAAQAVLDLANYPADSHTGMNLIGALEDFPRDEMLQMSPQSLWSTSEQILKLNERRRTRLFFRPDVFGRFITAMVFMPKDRYNTSVRRRVQTVLEEQLGAESADFAVQLTESAVARLSFRVKLVAETDLDNDYDAGEIEADVVQAVRSWPEGITAQALTTFGEKMGVEAAEQWGEAFPPSYRVRFEIEDALEDISHFNALADGGTSVQLLPSTDQDNTFRLRLYSTQQLSLTRLLPILAEMGLDVTDEYPFTVTPTTGETYYLYDLGVQVPDTVSIGAVSTLVENTIEQALSGSVEADAFNKLVLYQGIDPSMVNILRALAHYLRQLAVPNSLPFMAETLLSHPETTKNLADYFTTRFDPEAFGELDDDEPTPSSARLKKLDEIRQQVVASIDEAKTLDADRVLRGFLTVMEATDRTNAYQGHEWLSFKIAPKRINFAPTPRPEHEIWVHSPQVSGVHFRYGDIARGGLRWSDRQEDFRTEVLGLVQTQETKNSVIVPAGAKGGFYAHQLPDPSVDRDAWVEAGKDAYRTFMRGMLDITDKRKMSDGETIEWTRDGIIRHDDLDSYLVVAADKGTAGFSDTANEIAAEYDHWLGDAYASGGSVGYDHKGMAITARGAWESVKSHFGMLQRDIQNEDFTAVGIGDMSGDVFGNGMRRSRHTKLVAAFNHLHIFIDPDPDPEKSFEERERLYALPRSSWGDYDESLISEGGGVFDRSARSIGITDQMRNVFDIADDVEELAPQELLKEILTAPVDLIYNGGIGTYIKSSEESHDDVGDRANDSIRVDGNQIRALVVGEGGNLGATQKGRIEAARNGVRINMDAIDNSGGVSASDIEVNIKILIDQMLKAGKFDASEREDLLLSMTDEVADLILSINVAQNALLRIEESLDQTWMPALIRHTTWLEKHAGLDRELESIPTTKQLRARMAEGEGFATPELAILTAYTKIKLTNDLLETDIVTDEWFQQFLIDYFPSSLQEKAGDLLLNHPLAHHITAMTVANHIVNVGGITALFRAEEETGADLATLVRGFMVGLRVMGIEDHYKRLQELPTDMDPKQRIGAMVQMRRLSDRVLRWMIHNQRGDLPVQERIDSVREQIAELEPGFEELIVGDMAEQFSMKKAELVEAGFPDELAAKSASLFSSFSLLDIVTLAQEIDADPKRVAAMFFYLQEEFNITELFRMVARLSRNTRWESLARGAMREDLYSLLRELTSNVLASNLDDSKSVPNVVSDWESDHRRRVERVKLFLEEIQEEIDQDLNEPTDLSVLTVILRRLRSLLV